MVDVYENEDGNKTIFDGETEYAQMSEIGDKLLFSGSGVLITKFSR